MFLLHNLLFVSRAFDVEILFIAEKLKMSLGEVAVNWKEIEGNNLLHS